MCDLTAPEALTLLMDPAAPWAARAFLDKTHCPAHNTGVLRHARLLLSELATNAVRHGVPPHGDAVEGDNKPPASLHTRW